MSFQHNEEYCAGVQHLWNTWKQCFFEPIFHKCLYKNKICKSCFFFLSSSEGLGLVLVKPCLTWSQRCRRRREGGKKVDNQFQCLIWPFRMETCFFSVAFCVAPPPSCSLSSLFVHFFINRVFLNHGLCEFYEPILNNCFSKEHFPTRNVQFKFKLWLLRELTQPFLFTPGGSNNYLCSRARMQMLVSVKQRRDLCSNPSWDEKCELHSLISSK